MEESWGSWLGWWRLWTTAARRKPNRFLRTPMKRARCPWMRPRWARECSTCTRWRSFCLPRGVSCSWRSSKSNLSSGWMLTLRPLELLVHWPRRLQQAQMAWGKCTTPPGWKGTITWFGQVSSPCSQSM